MQLTENDISYEVIGEAIELHKTLGPALLESAYESALAYDLMEMGVEVKQQVPMPFIYKKVNQNFGGHCEIFASFARNNLFNKLQYSIKL